MKPRSSRIRRFLLPVAAGFAVLVIGGLLAVRAFLTPERLRDLTVRTLGDSTGLPVELAGARLAYAPLGISLEELRIGPAGDPTLSLPSGLAQFEILPLLRGQVVLDRILLENPAVVLRAAPAGGPRPGGSAGDDARPAGKPLQGAIRELEIRGGTLRWIPGDDSGDLTLGGVDLRASAAFDGNGARSEGTLSLRGLDLPALAAYSETIRSLEPVVDFRITYAAAEDRLTLEALTLQAPPLALTASGEVRNLIAAPVLSLSLDSAEQTLESLLPIIPPDFRPPPEVEASGHVALAASLEAALDAPEFTPVVAWRVGLRDVALTRGSTRVLSGGSGTVTGTADSVRVEALRATLGEGGVLEAEGAFLPADDFRVHAELAVEELVRAGLMPPGLEAAGRLEADVRSRQGQLSGPVRLRDGSFDGPDLVAPGSGWNLDGELEGADLRIDRLTGRIGSSALDLSGRVTSLREAPALSLSGRSPHFDLVELSARTDARIAAAGPGAALPPLIPVFPDLPTTLSLTADSVTVEGALWRTATLNATGRADSGRVQAEIASADYQGLVLRSFRADLALRGQTARGTFRTPEVNAYGSPLREVAGTIDLGADRILHLRDLAGRAWEGTMTGTADIDLTDPDRPGFDIRTKAAGLQADAFLSSTLSARNVIQGTLDLESSFRGKGAEPEEILKALTGSGSFTARDGRLVQTPFTAAVWKTLQLGERSAIPFRDLVTMFRVENGRILSDAIRLTGTEAVWDVAGSVGFDGTLDYRVQVALNDQLSNAFRQRVGPELAAVVAGTSGPLVIDLDVSGPAARPSIRVDRSALADRVKKDVKQGVKDKVTDKVTGGLKGLLGGGTQTAPPDSGG